MSIRVLLVEDELNIVATLKFVLERSGFEVGVANDGRQGLDIALSDTPDVLVLDVMLPEMDGYEVLRRLREVNETRNLPVLMLTAKGQHEDRQTALECGADMFITKPFANSEVLDAVEKLAKGRAG